MAGQSPAYLWYPKDMLSSGRVAALSPLEELWYRRALDQSWLGDGIPADPEKFAGWVGRGCTVEGATKLIAEFFVPHRKDASKVVNLRLEQERTNLQKKAALRAKAGIESGRKRRANSKLGVEHVFSKTRTQSEQTGNIPIAIATPIPRERKNPPTATPSVEAKLPPRQRDRGVRDPRCQHPAIAFVRNALGRFPDKSLWDDLIAVLGDTPDTAKLAECRKAWVQRGHNGQSVTWALEWYVTGIPTRHIQGNGFPTKTDRSVAVGLEMLERARAEERDGS